MIHRINTSCFLDRRFILVTYTKHALDRMERSRWLPRDYKKETDAKHYEMLSKVLLEELKQKRRPMTIELMRNGTTSVVFKLQSSYFICRVEQTYNRNIKLNGTRMIVVTVIDEQDIDDEQSNIYRHKILLGKWPRRLLYKLTGK